MPTHRLSNYLRMYRKRSALTQEELAFLLGATRDSKVSRYENGRRIPTFDAILAYSFIFNASLEDLFAGHYDEVAITIHKRAQRLLAKLGAQPASPALARKMQFLQELAHGQPPRDITR
ncbi:helix-turn-helix domain-containing protein [Patescibacteria group bacterium]|nr:helix-turn-helix domain-containing protein [Patescibacteria group bacterium]